MKLRKVIQHLFAGCFIALIVIIIIGYYNPFMGVLSGIEFKILALITAILLVVYLLLLVIKRNRN